MFFMAVLILSLNITDAFFTQLIIAHGGWEVNPFARAAMVHFRRSLLALEACGGLPGGHHAERHIHLRMARVCLATAACLFTRCEGVAADLDRPPLPLPIDTRAGRIPLSPLKGGKRRICLNHQASFLRSWRSVLAPSASLHKPLITSHFFHCTSAARPLVRPVTDDQHLVIDIP